MTKDKNNSEYIYIYIEREREREEGLKHSIDNKQYSHTCSIRSTSINSLHRFPLLLHSINRDRIFFICNFSVEMK
jgi:hypothetical protein